MSERLFTASVLAIIFSVLSLLCSLFNVVLIHVMQQWNGFLAILYSMTFCRILYDATFHVSSPLPKVETAKFRTTVSFDGILEGVGPFGLIIIMPGKVTHYIFSINEPRRDVDRSSQTSVLYARIQSMDKEQ
jgi:hypothetical protein